MQIAPASVELKPCQLKAIKDAAREGFEGATRKSSKLEAALAQAQAAGPARGSRKGVKRKSPNMDGLEEELEPIAGGISPTKTKLIDNAHTVSMGLLALANNMANDTKQQVSVAAPEDGHSSGRTTADP